MFVALAGVVVTVPAAAQSGDRDTGADVTFPGATAKPIAGAPTIDGQVLDDPVWTAIAPVTGFTQTTPDEGQPASERTEVRIAYSADTLYFGVVCYDGDPSTIIVSDSRRDSPLNETDSFLIILDTYLDQQNGFVFGTNPSGLEYDGQVTNEGQGSGAFVGGGRGVGGGRQQGGAGRGFNLNWDGSWEVRTQVSDIGWSAEFAIPFRTLRYSSGESQTWGLNFQRNIRRRNETAFWSALPRQYTLYRLSLAGQLTGLQLPPQRNLKIVPYALGDAVSNEFAGNDALLGDIGIDVKYSLTPSLTLDATYNTDFAQVEVDDQQVNLNRFNLFFPEKRPFFLENARPVRCREHRVGRALFQPTDRHRAGRGGDSYPGRRPPLGPDRRESQRRPAEHADAGSRGRRTVEQLHRGACAEGPAQPVERWRYLRQPAGRRVIWRGRTTTTGPTASTADGGSDRTRPSAASPRGPRPRI